MRDLPRLVIAATRGGIGKTTIALGIVAAWRRQGRSVAVFKKGPDFIDAGWLGVAADRPCYNLDPFMMAEERIVDSFLLHAADADAAVIEGNRGLYDGVDESGTYSTARLAALLRTPTALIVDCTKATSTVAAVVLGCLRYDPSCRIVGVILNNLASARHEDVIRKAVAKSSGLPVLGAIPRQRGGFPERHMGLTPFHEHPEAIGAIDAARALVERHCDLDALWSAAGTAETFATERDGAPRSRLGGPTVTVGVVRDKAFQFYYPDNLEALERHGAILREINALQDRALPADLEALYIGGGFPETQAAELAANGDFCRSVREAADDGLPIYAECGGLLYLGRSLTVSGRSYAMTGVFPADFILESRPQAHGYAVLEAGTSGRFLDAGTEVRGHEFHYSRLDRVDGHPMMAYDVRRGSGIDGKRDGLVTRNVVAAYTHIHALATPQWAPAMVRMARERQAGVRDAKRTR